MRKETIDRANEIISLIEKNERAIEELQKYAKKGKTLYTEEKYSWEFPKEIDFEDWEIRLIIHQKKQRVQALKIQLEKL